MTPEFRYTEMAIPESHGGEFGRCGAMGLTSKKQLFSVLTYIHELTSLAMAIFSPS